MFTIDNNIEERDVQPIIRLALENFADLANKVVRPSSSTGFLCKAILSAEIGAYLQDILTGYYGNLGGSIIVARNLEANILGFTLGMESSSADHCGISYAAVQKDSRKQGILRAMLHPFQQRYQTIDLSCHPKTVSIYQALGFRPYGRQAVQIAMRWGAPKPQGIMPTINVESFESVRVAHATAYRDVPQKDWNSLVNARDTRIREIMKFLGGQLPIQHLSITD
ncbi:GNAT family N-acetyltransferase [Pseudomonas sp.]|jgi:hypothetical protein|uniref:GNAT family N-acetyltransferase n=1 Tax=Pseudomonas sp. TaxID=306 RepID=UPI002E3220C1|nr:GNAT family N-acetyltransferase [Pseudomonas sp.]HEX4549803.1 GNAT family N-acetyltransferase [Pseudomonas sp.]